MAEKHKIVIDTTVLSVVHPCRKVPFALRDGLKEQLDRMESLGVITRVEEPTDWVNSLVVAMKPNGEFRVCMDPRDLNRAIKREHYIIPTREEIMSQFAGARYFSKLDAKQGFWQLQLDDELLLKTSMTSVQLQVTSSFAEQRKRFMIAVCVKCLIKLDKLT